MKKLIIAGSSRNDGDTSKLVRQLTEKSDWNQIDLNDFDFSYYDYLHHNKNDDYLPLMRKIISQYDAFIFATPIYWYSMSGIMKVFFDRLTDLLTIEKELGRQLRGKKMAVITCSVGENLGEQFWLPFSETANYLGMDYLGDTHTITGEDNDSKIQSFIDLVNKKAV